ncbi:G patch domain and ankyrin repeat-containing protein 1 homolog [Aphomia sociella]
MLKKDYSNFVRPHSPTEAINSKATLTRKFLTGEEARRIYLEEVKEVKVSTHSTRHHEYSADKEKRIHKLEALQISDKDLFITVQNNDIDTLKQALDSCPDKINVIDEYGWSLLMIACQANSVDAVKELLNRGIDTTIRDKAGNSAQSLVIKNKNYVLADILLSNKKSNEVDSIIPTKHVKVKLKEEYVCEICGNKSFSDKEEHLSSTIHNINASKNKKLPANYVIPETNKGYQLMLKVGWDKDSGLGPEGTGKKYPIKTVQKMDRKGLGHGKRKENLKKEIVKNTNRKLMLTEYQRSKKMEINFRREFY